MWILSVQSLGNEYRQQHFHTKGMRTYRRKPDSFLGLLQEISPATLTDPEDKRYDTASFKTDLLRFQRCMLHISTALYFHEIGTQWKGGCRVVTDAFAGLEGLKAEGLNELFNDITQTIARLMIAVPAKGENPQIFTYKLASPKPDKHVVHMRFYEGIAVSVILSDA